jgi:hypothetical protein
MSSPPHHPWFNHPNIRGHEAQALEHNFNNTDEYVTWNVSLRIRNSWELRNMTSSV